MSSQRRPVAFTSSPAILHALSLCHDQRVNQIQLLARKISSRIAAAQGHLGQKVSCSMGRNNERVEIRAPDVWALGEYAGSPQFTYVSSTIFRSLAGLPAENPLLRIRRRHPSTPKRTQRCGQAD